MEYTVTILTKESLERNRNLVYGNNMNYIGYHYLKNNLDNATILKDKLEIDGRYNNEKIVSVTILPASAGMGTNIN